MDKFLLLMGKIQPMRGKILIIDDNEDLTGIISIILKAEGFEVKTRATLEFCEEVLDEWDPDLLLLDVNVNGEDGRIFCSQKKSHTDKDVKIILMSGDETTLDHTHWFGADDCIAKPFDSADLIQKIHLCLHASTKNT